MNKKIFLVGVAAVLGIAGVSSQVRIGGEAIPSKASILDLNFSNTTNDGILGLALPRVALGGINAPLSDTEGHLKGLLVYNTATTSDVTPGVYYDDGEKWVRTGIGTSISLESGPNPGTVKLTVNGVVTENIPVAGLKSAAYKEDTAFLASPGTDASGKVLLGPATSSGAPGTKGIASSLPLSASDDLITSAAVYNHAVSDISANEYQILVTKAGVVTSFTVPGFPITPTPNQVLATAASGSTDTDPSLRSLVVADIPPLDAGRIAANTIGTTRLENGAVTSDKLVDKAVTAAQLVNKSVSAGKLATDAVTTQKIADAAVTRNKIGGPIAIDKGGTGTTSLTPNGVIYAATADAMASTTAGSPTGQFLKADASLLPTWQPVDILLEPSNPVPGAVLQYTAGGDWVAGVLPSSGEGSSWSCLTCGTVTDVDKNTYHTNIFGAAGRWMTENLKVTHFELDKDEPTPITPDGNEPTTTTDRYPFPIEYTICRYHYPNKVPKMQFSCGVLYNWVTVHYPENNIDINQGGETHDPTQGPCPYGWHVPTDLEWIQLEEEMVANPHLYSTVLNPILDDHTNLFNGWNRGPHGAVMKSPIPVISNSDIITTQGFSKPAANGGFAALMAGSINAGGAVDSYGLTASFWSSSSYTETYAWGRELVKAEQEEYIFGVYKNPIVSKLAMLSIRCKENNL